MPGSYTTLFGGELERRAEEAVSRLRSCRMCPRECGVNRLEGELGVCGTGRHARIAHHDLHFGEEKPLVGRYGSGTIFFAHCNLDCVFCQNSEISHPGPGEDHPEHDAEALARVMLELQAKGAENINLVTPSHLVAQILEALPLAVGMGLAVPLVYNTSAYDSVETLKLLDGVVDIYMPDVKFWDPEEARTYCAAPNYPEAAREALGEMHRQVGELHIDASGVARRGVLVRHLVMPEGLAGTREWMRFLARELSAQTYVNIMGQYHPCRRAGEFPALARAVNAAECREAKDLAAAAGITRLDEVSATVVADLLRQLMAEDE